MDTDADLNEGHRQVLGLEKLRRKRGYREGWLYYLCRQKGLLRELQEMQVAGLVGDAPGVPGTTGAIAPGSSAENGEGGEIVMSRTLLTVELVPSTCWFSNLRSELSRD